MEPRCNHLGNRAQRLAECPGNRRASMEPRCNHLGNSFCEREFAPPTTPQWSPGVITWETSPSPISAPNAPRPQWSPGVITWETLPGLAHRDLDVLASMEPRCNHLGNAALALGGARVALASMEPRCNHLGNPAMCRGRIG